MFAFHFLLFFFIIFVYAHVVCTSVENIYNWRRTRDVWLDFLLLFLALGIGGGVCTYIGWGLVAGVVSLFVVVGAYFWCWCYVLIPAFKRFMPTFYRYCEASLGFKAFAGVVVFYSGPVLWWWLVKAFV